MPAILHNSAYSFKDRLLLEVVSWLLRTVVAVIGATLRIKTSCTEHAEFVGEGAKGVIWALWHGRMFVPLYAHRDQGTCVLVSQHRDGELIARVLLSFGYNVVRGSTTRGGSRALAEMVRKARKGSAFAFTPDGPKGPARKVQPGVIYLAQRTGMPIVPVAGSAKRKKIFDSWDGFLLPMPFSRACVVLGEPLSVGRDLSAGALKALAKDLENRLNAATTAADTLCEI